MSRELKLAGVTADLHRLDHEGDQVGADMVKKLGAVEDGAKAGMQDAVAQATASGNALTSQMAVAVIIGLLLSGVFGWFIVRAITRPLSRALHVTEKLAEGDFDVDIEVTSNDEMGTLLSAMKHMQAALHRFVEAQSKIAEQHADGWISERIDTSQFAGTYRTMAEQINELVGSHIAVKMKVVEVITQYSQGDFSVDMDRLPGEKAKITQAVDDVKKALLSISNEIQALAEAGAEGDFSKRGDVEQYQFMFREMIENMNQLIETCDVGFSDVMRVAKALADGDLTQVITKDYPGVFGETKNAVNGTTEALKEIVDEIRKIVEAAALHGDFSVKMDMDGKRGYTKTLSELLNQLSEVTDTGLRDVTRVASALAEGDLSQTITEDYPGLFGRTKVAVNGTVESLSSLVEEIRRIVEAAAVRGDFSVEMEMAGKRGYTKTLSELLNQLSEVTDTGLKDVMRVARALAEGDLTQTISKDYPGLFGDTKEAVNRTVENLQSLVTRIKAAVDTINTAAQEIASGNQDLSQRTEEQASSLEETASSMEELTSTVKQNAENAIQANQLAASSSDVATKGGDVVRASVQTMAEISESSKKIADIIGVIDGIAFQTNILALNASVEAARAGEQGRGFAVVAGEVRNLAQRSAGAAKEIKDLITDSVEKVEAGSAQVNEAGDTMVEIVNSIKRVTDIMAEISAASAEQSTGIEQVNKAVTQMDEVTQQNAALVEEAAASAESLEEQAQGLAEAVSVFKLDNTSAAGAVTTPRSEPKAPNKRKSEVKSAAYHSESKPTIRHTGAAKDDDGDEWQEF